MLLGMRSFVVGPTVAVELAWGPGNYLVWGAGNYLVWG
jgi:hypothetical protein